MIRWDKLWCIFAICRNFLQASFPGLEVARCCALCPDHLFGCLVVLNILLKQLFVGQSSSYQFPLIIFVQDSTETHQSHCLRQNLKSVQKNLRLPCLSGPNLPWLCAGLQYCIQRCCEHCHSRTKECWGSSKLLLNHFKTIFWNIFQVEFHDEDWLCPYMSGLVENS